MSKFGWCLDGLHKKCRRTLTNQNGEAVRCSCTHETCDCSKKEEE